MNIGIIGCGGMGTTHNLCLKELSKHYDIKVTAIADCRDEFLDKAGVYWKGVKKFKDGRELIDQSNIDIVHICVPSYLHAELAILAMQKRMNVLLEKPVCINKKDCQRLLDMEKKTGVKIMAAQVVRFFDEYRFLKDIYSKKTYGKLKSMMMHRISGNPTWGWEEWFHDIERSGSVILDLHIHDIDFLRYMIGEPKDYQVLATKFDSGMPNQVISVFKYEDLFAVAEGSMEVSSKVPFEAYYKASFEDATVEYSSINQPHVSIYHKDGTVTTPEIERDYNTHDDSAGINISDLGGYYNEIKYFLDCIIEKKPVEEAPLSEGVKSVLFALDELSEVMK